MSANRLRAWLNQALAGRVEPESAREICDLFVKIASADAPGQRIYIPTGHVPKCQQFLPLIETLLSNGESLRDVACKVGVSHECVRIAVKKSDVLS